MKNKFNSLQLNNKNLVLIGFSGSGKTIIGKTISELYKLPFIDTDISIQISQNLSIHDIFRKFGEEHFRNLEAEICKELPKKQNTIISIGGGTILSPQNAYFLQQNSIIVYLKSSPEQIYKNLKYDDSRPLLNTSNKLATITKLLEERTDIYEEYSDICISSVNKSPLLVALQIQKSIS